MDPVVLCIIGATLVVMFAQIIWEEPEERAMTIALSGVGLFILVGAYLILKSLLLGKI